MSSGATASLFALLMILAGVGDCLNRRIPNSLVLIIALSFFPFAVSYGLAGREIGLHVLAGILMLAIAYACFAAGFLGGGDAKLLSAVSLWFGVSGSANFVIMAAVAGGALALAIAAWSWLSFEADLRDVAGHARLAAIRPSLPYGFAISAGAILAAPGAWWGPAVPFWTLLTTH